MTIFLQAFADYVTSIAAIVPSSVGTILLYFVTGRLLLSIMMLIACMLIGGFVWSLYILIVVSRRKRH